MKIYFSDNENITSNKIKKKIGVFGYTNDNNIGNNLVKFSMYILLRNLGFEPTMVAPSDSYDLYFIKKYLNIREIKNFSEINENDYDILMVNSDQTWSAQFRYLLNIGFDNSFDIIFGNGTYGKKLKDGQVVTIEYLSHNGLLGNIKTKIY